VNPSTIASHPALDVTAVRQHFPSLAIEERGRPVVYFDNPGGTQVPRECIDAIVAYLTTSNANTYGAYATSARTVAMLDDAHAAMADLLNAADPREIVFGPNMTTLAFAMSRAIGRTLRPGDEIVVTDLDHDANIAPWLALQEERGAVVRAAGVDLTTCTLDMADLRSKITARTKLVAVGYASNAVGTINDVATIVGWAREAGALSWIDAVQLAPHGPIDVQALGCDFLACSAYKFFGPHLGIVYGRLPLLQDLAAYKVRPASDEPPGKWETGTQNHECLAGLVGTLAYLAGLGRDQLARYAPMFPAMAGRRLELHAALAAIQEYERALAARLLAGLQTLPGVRTFGLTAPEDLPRRVPTVALTIADHTPRELAAALGERDIFAWDGNYYALALMERLGLEATGGALRLGLVHYNTAEEVDRALAALHEIVG
jgi:cysteine desulfurase family protein (TIGR01976 family)